MRRLSALVLLSLGFLASSCVEGPAGPPGRDGEGGIRKDSLVFDAMAPFLVWAAQDTGMELSPSARERYEALDRSLFHVDSVQLVAGGKDKVVLVRTPYDPVGWEARRVATGHHALVDSGTVPWIARRHRNAIAEAVTPLAVIDWGGVGDYYLGKGFSLPWAAFYPVEGRVVIYFWR